MKFYHNELKKIRKKSNYSVAHISVKLGISQKTYYRWETGETIPSQSDTRILANLLGVNEKNLSNIEPLFSSVELDMMVNSYLRTEILPTGIQAIINKFHRIIVTKNEQISYLTNHYRNYVNIVETHPFSFYVKNESLEFTESNITFASEFNVAGEIKGKTNKNVFQDIEESNYFNIVENNAKNNISIENLQIKLNNKLYCLTLHKRLTDGKFSGLLGTLFRSTELEEYKSKLNKLEYIINNTDYAFWIRTPSKENFKYLFFSKNTELIYGYPREKFYFSNNFFDSIIHPKDRNTVRKMLHPESNILYPASVEYRLKKPDNSYYWFRSEYYYNEAENFIYGITKDISKEYNSNKMIEDLQETINDKENKIYIQNDLIEVLKNMLDLVPNSFTFIFEKTEKTKILFLSSKYEKISRIKKNRIKTVPYYDMMSSDNISQIEGKRRNKEYPISYNFYHNTPGKENRLFKLKEFIKSTDTRTIFYGMISVIIQK